MTTPAAATKARPLGEETYLALCVYDEARGQPWAGQLAVARVVLNRARLRYSSDGTIRGTVLRPNQFSGFYFDAVRQKDGRWKYVRVATTMAQADARAAQKHAKAILNKPAWQDALTAARTIYTLEEDNMPLPKDAVLYYNPDVVMGTPSWAKPANMIKRIGDHVFFRA